MNRTNRNNSIQVIKPSQPPPPPPPPVQSCHQGGPDSRKGRVARAVERLQKGFSQSSFMNRVNDKKRTIVNIHPGMVGSNWSLPGSAGPSPAPVTPTRSPPVYNYPMKMPPTKPKMGPKPGDLAILQKFFGVRTPITIAEIRRLACSSNEEGSTPLHQAARESGAEEVAALIRMGAPVDARDYLGFTPAHKAAAAGSVQVLQLLKFAGANLEAEGNHGYWPIHRAAMNGGMEAVRWLVEQGSPVDTTTSGGWTPLHLAVWWDREAVVRCLLEMGASVNYISNNGMSPLGLAISGHHQDLARILMFYGGAVER